MGNNQEYNGWTNYETWLAALWIDNDGYGEELREQAEKLLSGNDGAKDYARNELLATIKSYIEEFTPEMPNSMYADLLSAALSEINYYEIAEHYVEDAAAEAFAKGKK